MSKLISTILSVLVMGTLTISYGTMLKTADSNMAKASERPEVYVESPEVVEATGDDVDKLLIFSDRLCVMYNDEITTTLTLVGDHYQDGDISYEFHEVQGVRDSENGSTFEVIGYNNPNMVMLYSVYDDAPSNTNFCLIKLGRTCVQDEVVAYGRRN